MTWHPKWLLPPSLLACLVLLNPSWADDLLPTAVAVAGVLTGSGTTGESYTRKYYELYNIGDFLDRVRPTAGRGTPDRRLEGIVIRLSLLVLRR